MATEEPDPAAWPVGVKEDYPEEGHALLSFKVRVEVCQGGQQPDLTERFVGGGL